MNFFIRWIILLFIELFKKLRDEYFKLDIFSDNEIWEDIGTNKDFAEQWLNGFLRWVENLIKA